MNTLAGAYLNTYANNTWQIRVPQDTTFKLMMEYRIKSKYMDGIINK